MDEYLDIHLDKKQIWPEGMIDEVLDEISKSHVGIDLQ